MADETGAVYFGSVEPGSESDATWEGDRAEVCALCGHSPPTAVRDVGEVIQGNLAIARWWPLCLECVRLADAGDRERLVLRATPDIQDAGWGLLVVEALLAGTDA